MSHPEPRQPAEAPPFAGPLEPPSTAAAAAQADDGHEHEGDARRDPRELGQRIHELADRESADAEREEVSRQSPEHERAAASDELHELTGAAAQIAALGLVPVDDDALADSALGVCPFCDGYGACDADAILRALPSIIEKVAPFPQSSVFERCEECDGWGSVLTGARRGEPGIQPCPKCDGNGYVDVREQRDTARPLAPAPERVDELPEFIGKDPLRTPPPEGKPPAIGMVWDQGEYMWRYPPAA